MYGARQPQYRHQRRAVVEGQLVQLPAADELGTLVVQTARSFAVRHKYLTAYYLLGLVMLGVLTVWGGSTLTPQQAHDYNQIMNSIDLQAEYDAVDEYWAAAQRYRATKGWFWACDSVCQRHKRSMQQAEQRLNAIRAEGNARMSDAKAIAGLHSQVAVTEMQDSFWQYLAAGKRFAKRQTAWDVLWMGLRSVHRGRDESWMEYAVKILIYLLVNFSLGLLSALTFFVLGLWNILRSYQPNPVTAVLVFLLAAAAATSFVLSYLLLLTSAAAASVYGVAKLAESSQQQRIAQQQQQERLRGQPRPHAD